MHCWDPSSRVTSASQIDIPDSGDWRAIARTSRVPGCGALRRVRIRIRMEFKNRKAKTPHAFRVDADRCQMDVRACVHGRELAEEDADQAAFKDAIRGSVSEVGPCGVRSECGTRGHVRYQVRVSLRCMPLRHQ